MSTYESLRPPELANDPDPAIKRIEDAVDTLAEIGLSPYMVDLLARELFFPVDVVKLIDAVGRDHVLAELEKTR
jgi:hypothetical protein